MLDRLSPSPRLRMLLRRGTILGLALALMALSGIAGLIASRDYTALERDVIARIERESGVTIRFAARRQVLWPKPQIVFEGVTLERPAQDIAMRAPQVILSFSLVDLLDGVIDGPLLTLVGPQIEIAGLSLAGIGHSPRALTDTLDKISALLGEASSFTRFRITVHGAHVTLRNATGSGETLVLEPVEAGLRYAAAGERIDLFARHAASLHPVEASLSLPTRRALALGKALSANFNLSGYESRLTFAGQARRDPDLALVGRLDLALGERLEQRWLGQPAATHQHALETTMLSSSISLDPRGIGLESLRIERAAKQLAGIAALRELNGRWGVSATLAGDLVDGSAAQAALQALRETDGRWTNRPLALNPLPGLDLDIRLSTKAFRLGNVMLDNVALSILTRKDRAEFAVVDSHFGEGTVKARVSLAEAADGAQELRLQASGDKVDAGKLLDRAIGFSRLSGEGALVIQMEGRGTGVAALVATLAGSAAMEVQAGELLGVDLARLLARAQEPRPELALVYALAGKTAFEALRANFAIKDGRIEPVGSSFTSARVSAMLEGAIDLPLQRHQLALVLKRRTEEPGQPSEFFAFRLEGPLFSPSLKPDPKLLLNRS
jgi:AsmA-like C-terminal region